MFCLQDMLTLPEQSREDALRHKAPLFGLYQGLLRFIFWVRLTVTSDMFNLCLQVYVECFSKFAYLLANRWTVLDESMSCCSISG